MSRKKKPHAAATVDATKPAGGSGPQERRSVGVRLAGIVLRALSYRELEGRSVDAQAVQSATNFSVDFSASANLAFADTTAGQLTLSMSIRPDPAVRPLEIDVVMSAGFQRDETMSVRDFLDFISNSGGVIIFPYVRELVASLTMRSPFGHVVLNPMRVGPLLQADVVERFAKELEAGVSATHTVAAG